MRQLFTASSNLRRAQLLVGSLDPKPIRSPFWFLTTALVSLLPSAPSLAQMVPNLPPPSRYVLDQNGVNVATGKFTVQAEELSIGPEGPGGLQFARQYSLDGVSGSFGLALYQDGTKWRASIGFSSLEFNEANGAFTSALGDGSTLVQAGTSYIVTTSDGTKYTYDVYIIGNNSPPHIKASKVEFSTGERLTLTWARAWVCTNGMTSCAVFDQKDVTRLQSVTNNSGYMIHFKYNSDATPTLANYDKWLQVDKATAINLGLDYCAPLALDCTGLTQTAPFVTYTTAVVNGVTTYTATRAGSPSPSQTMTYVFGPQQIQVIPPAPYAAKTIALSAGGTVTTVTRDSSSTNYNYSVSSNLGTMVTTDPLGHSRTIVSNLTVGLPTSVTDGLGRTTSYSYDPANGRLTQITQPGGGFVQFSYDGRGNKTREEYFPRFASTPTSIAITAGYDASCVSPAKCNKPNWTKDAANNQQDFVYDLTTGQLLTATSPPAPNGIRPQTRYTYSALQAYYKNSSGAIAASGSAISKLTQISTCQTAASCTGNVADEVRTAIGYGSAGVANNLLPISVATGSGDGALTATTTFAYDSVGNLLTSDGPLPGSGDTTLRRYDAMRRLVGVVSPDPDGIGDLKSRVVRRSYDAGGMETSVAQGRVGNQSDDLWSGAFEILANVDLFYDVRGRKVKDVSSVGGVAASVIQYAYDADDRLICTAQRMNPGVFTSLPSSACSLGTAGSFGPDRIIQTNYDAADRVTSTIEALGTAGQRTALALTYSDNDKLLTLADGKGNKTSYVYDGYDRLWKTLYPTASNGGVSNASDFEQLTYDVNSNVIQRTLRDGKVINYSYDLLNRMTLKDVPSGAYGEGDISYTYDNLGRLTSVSRPDGHYVNATYDALGRRLSESSVFGTKASQYDLAGRRTRLTYPGGFYVTYDVDTLSEVTAIRENGAASGVGVLATLSYDDLGRRTRLMRGNGTTTAYSYDAAARLATLTQELAGTAQDLTVTLGSYNPAGQIGSRVSSNDIYAWTAHYNVNRPYTANGLNQYTVAGATAFGYDVRGNLTASGSVAYTYTSENRLNAAGSSLIYYDPVGRILLNSYGSVSERFDYDGDAMIVEMDGNGAVVRRYVHGPWADEPLVWYEGAGTGDRRWLHADERGSIVAVSDASGTALAANSYSEYGINGTIQYGRFGYTGQAWFADAGLYWFKARHYSPTLGRFLQTDPIGYDDGPNWYNYVRSDPINSTDPSGTEEGGPPLSQVRLPEPFGGITSYVTGSRSVLTMADAMAVGFVGGTGFAAVVFDLSLALTSANTNSRKSNTQCYGPPASPGTNTSKAELAALARNNAAEAASQYWNPLNLFWFRSKVQNKGPWDYKQYNRGFQDFGNYNYGRAGAAMGLATDFLLGQAGRAQRAAGTSRPEWGYPGFLGYGDLGGTGSFGDDPRDQEMIKRGIADQRSGC